MYSNKKKRVFGKASLNLADNFYNKNTTDGVHSGVVMPKATEIPPTTPGTSTEVGAITDRFIEVNTIMGDMQPLLKVSCVTRSS